MNSVVKNALSTSSLYFSWVPYLPSYFKRYVTSRNKSQEIYGLWSEEELTLCAFTSYDEPFSSVHHIQNWFSWMYVHEMCTGPVSHLFRALFYFKFMDFSSAIEFQFLTQWICFMLAFLSGTLRGKSKHMQSMKPRNASFSMTSRPGSYHKRGYREDSIFAKQHPPKKSQTLWSVSTELQSVSV
jgi:hypothetical protein